MSVLESHAVGPTGESTAWAVRTPRSCGTTARGHRTWCVTAWANGTVCAPIAAWRYSRPTATSPGFATACRRRCAGRLFVTTSRAATWGVSLPPRQQQGSEPTLGLGLVLRVEARGRGTRDVPVGGGSRQVRTTSSDVLRRAADSEPKPSSAPHGCSVSTPTTTSRYGPRTVGRPSVSGRCSSSAASSARADTTGREHGPPSTGRGSRP